MWRQSSIIIRGRLSPSDAAETGRLVSDKVPHIFNLPRAIYTLAVTRE